MRQIDNLKNPFLLLKNISSAGTQNEQDNCEGTLIVTDWGISKYYRDFFVCGGVKDFTMNKPRVENVETI
jgi:hypothetical protein